MTPTTLVGILLLVAGILAIAYGGFTYTEETHDVDLGPLDIEVKERERVNIPLWVGVAAAAIGAGVIIAETRRVRE